jgi:hypothetical protein
LEREAYLKEKVMVERERKKKKRKKWGILETNYQVPQVTRARKGMRKRIARSLGRDPTVGSRELAEAPKLK